MSKDKISLPSVLAFDRKLEVSDGLMYSGDYDNRGKTIEHKPTDKKTKEDKPTDEKTKEFWKPIPIVKRHNRATQSAYGITDDKKTQPNPVSSDSDKAVLPPNSDTLKVSWTMRIIGNVGTPFACNAPDFTTAIKKETKEFKEQDSFKQLAFRYAYNIVNGRFLWRNRVCANNIEIQVYIKDKQEPLIFNAYEFSLNNFDEIDNDDFKKLVDEIYDGLKDDTGESFVFMKIDAYVQLGDKQEVYPSQEMNTGEKKKVLFRLDDCAAMHNVKIGNAIRTIDTWHTKADEVGAIAIEPYGSVTQQGDAYRKTKDDLYTLMMKWVKDEKITDNDKNYITANLIRGGVFGGK